MHRLRLIRVVLPGVLLLGIVGAFTLGASYWHTLPADAKPQFVGSPSCRDCHPGEDRLWQGSDHQLAMDLATPNTVLGDFANREFTHFGTQSRMYRRGEEYWVHTDGPDGKLTDYPIKYVFGVRPLQQYLVEFPGGRLQCLPIAWDTVNRRWFHLYPNEAIPFDDPLHWTRPLQNWNYMCAECHSTNLQKNYDLPSDRYHTTWSEISVGCECCHGAGSLHNQLAASWKPFWDRKHGYGLPTLKGEDSRRQIETCAPCHARRRIVYPGFKPGEKFLDYYCPELLDSEAYWPDGQIRDEDYEYGSFIQSKMYHNKVRCSDCHDPHSLRVKFKEGPVIRDSRLCGQCHLPAKYDTATHHHHPDSTKAGTLCIECHMPKTKYMVVDPRLDHSIRVPRPDLTVDLGIPNACNGCHDDAKKGETPQWAAEKVAQWYGPRKGPKHFAYAIAAGRQGKPEAAVSLDAVVRRKDAPAMVRASALVLLARYGIQAVMAAAVESLGDAEELVRVAAVRSLDQLAGDDLRRWVLPMVQDPIRAVRTEAARIVSVLPRSEVSAKYAEAFDRSLAEYMTGQKAVADQAPAHLCMGVIHANQGQRAQAEADYQQALRMDPAFLPARINLGMLYDQAGKRKEAETQFRETVRRDPKLGEAWYSLGLLTAEDEKRLAEAAECLQKAATLNPRHSRIHYNLGLAYQTLGRYEDAERALKQALALEPQNADYRRALDIFAAQRRQRGGR